MADNVTHPVDGLAYLEFNLSLPSQVLTQVNKLVALDAHRIYETVFGYGQADITFQVQNTQFLDRILKALDANGSPLINFRWGLGQGGSQIAWVPWQLHYVLSHQSLFQGIGGTAGHFIKLSTRDQLHLIDRASKTAAHRGTISSILRRIATANGLTDSVVEDTQGEGVWIQSFEGDFEFVRERLVCRARSKRGRGNYFLYVRDNVLHFHTLEYQTTVKDLNYYSSPGTRLEAMDLSQAKINDGSAGVRLIYHDPYTGLSKEVNSDPNQALRLGNSIPRLDKIAGAQRNIREHRVQIRDEEAGPTALAQNAYEYARAESFQLKMQTTNTAFLRPGELLRINIDPSAGTASSWSGLYLVATAQHVIDKGSLNSVYVLQRGEQLVSRSGVNSLPAYGVNNLQDDQNAPGYEVSLRDAQDSVLTRGAGKTVGSGVFLTTQDSNAAPVPPAKPLM